MLCHGVLGYLDEPDAVVDQLCRCVADGGVVSIMTGNADAMAVRPALEQRWHDALASFDARTETGVLGVPTRLDMVETTHPYYRSGYVFVSRADRHLDISSIIDPRLRQPPRRLAGVSVRAPTCMIADALTKIVMVDPASAPALLRLERAAALIVAANGELSGTPEWDHARAA